MSRQSWFLVLFMFCMKVEDPRAILMVTKLRGRFYQSDKNWHDFKSTSRVRWVIIQWFPGISNIFLISLPVRFAAKARRFTNPTIRWQIAARPQSEITTSFVVSKNTEKSPILETPKHNIQKQTKAATKTTERYQKIAFSNRATTVKYQNSRIVRVIRINVQYDIIDSGREAENSKNSYCTFFRISEKLKCLIIQQSFYFH